MALLPTGSVRAKEAYGAGRSSSDPVKGGHELVAPRRSRAFDANRAAKASLGTSRVTYQLLRG